MKTKHLAILLIGAATLLLSHAELKAAPLLDKEIPVIKKAAERNRIKYGSDDWYLLLAIRMAENGGKGKEFGILNSKANTLDLQAAWCACTIRNQHKRYGSLLVTEDFIISLCNRYCPVGADNDPKGLNVNWIKNVKYWFWRLKNERLLSTQNERK